MNILVERANACLGKLEFGESTLKRQVAAGSIIRANNKVLLATAAHCIFDPYVKAYYNNVVFSLLTENFKNRYKVEKSFLPKKWIEEGTLQCDTAFALLDSEEFDMTRNYENAVVPKFNLSLGLEYTIMGFPTTFLISNKKPLSCRGKAIQHKKYKSIIQGIKCENKNGMSGGPWLTIYNGKTVQNSVSSFSFKADDDILWGPFWDDTIESVLHIACGINMSSPDVVVKDYTC